MTITHPLALTRTGQDSPVYVVADAQAHVVAHVVLSSIRREDQAHVVWLLDRALKLLAADVASGEAKA